MNSVALTSPARRELDDLPIVISTFVNKYDTIPHQETLTWGALRERLSVHQRRSVKDGPLFSPVSYKEGATRGKKGVDRIFLAVADIDNPAPDDKGGGVADEDVITPERLLALLPPELEALVVSSHRSTPERPKFRVIIPFETPCPAEQWERDHVWQALQDLIWKGISDEATKDTCRFYYLPSCPPDAKPLVLYRPGKALDWTTLPPVPEARTDRQTSDDDAPIGVVANGGAGRPGDDFNAHASWADILEPHGWVRVSEAGEEGRWRRPDKGDGWSATTNYKGSGLLYVFSSSAEPFEPDRGYSKFAAYALLNHGGDFRAAAADLGQRGWGSQDSSRDSIRVVNNPMDTVGKFSPGGCR